MLRRRLLDPPHRRGDLVNRAWRWTKDGLAVAVRGREGQMIWENLRKEGTESVLSLSDSICCGKLCNLFKWGSMFSEHDCRITHSHMNEQTNCQSSFHLQFTELQLLFLSHKETASSINVPNILEWKTKLIQWLFLFNNKKKAFQMWQCAALMMEERNNFLFCHFNNKLLECKTSKSQLVFSVVFDTLFK